MLLYLCFIGKTYNNILKIHNIKKLCDVLKFLSQICLYLLEKNYKNILII